MDARFRADNISSSSDVLAGMTEDYRARLRCLAGVDELVGRISE